MKIKTITCHYVYNHGASLQAYALQSYLERCGHQVEIIDYRPSYLTEPYRFFCISNPRWRSYLSRRLIYMITHIPQRIVQHIRKASFHRFTKEYLKLTPMQYYTVQELATNPPVADLYICGSDQIWNPLFQNGKDPAFYLAFGGDGSKRISYAASFAVDQISADHAKAIEPLLKSLDGISVREETGLAILHDIGMKDACCVLDPVFLLHKHDWLRFVEPYKGNRYVLTYIFEANQLAQEITKCIAKEDNLRIYSVTDVAWADKRFYTHGPIQFLNLLYHADTIVTNSFHAVAFSVIFKKNFWVLKREGTNSRLFDFLKRYGLEHRIIQSPDDLCRQGRIDYLQIEENLNEWVLASKAYLQQWGVT